MVRRDCGWDLFRRLRRATVWRACRLIAAASAGVAVGPEAVPDAADRFDHVGQGVELLAERADVDVDRALEGVGVLAPREIHQFVAGEGAARLARESPEDLELG